MGAKGVGSVHFLHPVTKRVTVSWGSVFLTSAAAVVGPAVHVVEPDGLTPGGYRWVIDEDVTNKIKLRISRLKDKLSNCLEPGKLYTFSTWAIPMQSAGKAQRSLETSGRCPGHAVTYHKFYYPDRNEDALIGGMMTFVVEPSWEQNP